MSSNMKITNVTAIGLFYYLFFPAVILFITYYRFSRRRLYELAAKIPGPDGIPLLGTALEFYGLSPESIVKELRSRSDLYPGNSPVKVWFGPRLFVIMQDPRDVEVVLGSHVHIDKSPEYSFFKPWLGNGLLLSSGEHWRLHRKLIAPTFHLNVLKSFIDLFNDNSRAVVQRMSREAESGREFDAHDYMGEVTVEILLETAMGVSRRQQHNGSQYAAAVMKMCDILHMRHVKVWLRSEIIFRLTRYGREQRRLLGIIHGLTRRVIAHRRRHQLARGAQATPALRVSNERDSAAMSYDRPAGPMSYGKSGGLTDDLDDADGDLGNNDVGEKRRPAFLDLLIDPAQNAVVLTDQEIKEEVDTIMFEGHDTTAAASSFFLCLMGLHQGVQDKVADELDAIFGDAPDRAATFQDTLEMKYLERCLLETLRLYPPVPIIGRELKQEATAGSSGHILPAGCTVVIATSKVHRQPEIYPNPTQFDPDNFLPERCASRHYYSFVPFSAGPRSCVGRKYAMLKLKILLSTILRNYRIHSSIPEEDYQLTADIILKRADGFMVAIEPRQNKSSLKTKYSWTDEEGILK